MSFYIHKHSYNILDTDQIVLSAAARGGETILKSKFGRWSWRIDQL